MSYSTIVLINRKGKEQARLRPIPQNHIGSAWIMHDGQWWGFGVAKLNGEAHFYQVEPETPPMGGKEAA